MSDPRDFTLERVNRLTQAVGDLMENHASQGRMTTRLLMQMSERLTSIDATLSMLAQDVRALASEQILLGNSNRVEDALARALRANSRLDAIEDDHDDRTITPL